MDNFINKVHFDDSMTDLIACLSSGKGTWGHVARLIEGESWDKVFLITNEFGVEKFQKTEKTHFILVDSRKGLKELTEDIKSQLQHKTSHEVALNLVSGSGKEHMAMISAVMGLGLAFRLMALTKNGIEEI